MIKQDNPEHRLFILIRDKKKPTITWDDGRVEIPKKWIEVSQINLGSCKYPKKDIFQVKWVPVEYEKDGTEKPINFKRFLGGLFGQ